MQKKQFFGTIIIALLLITSFLVLDHAAVTKAKEETTCCKKTSKPCIEEVNPTPNPAEPVKKGSENAYPGSSSLIFNFSS